MTKVEFQRIHKSFNGHVVIPGLDLKIEAGEFVALVGPSGCGKSTCLRMLAGLEEPTSGRIFIGDRDVTDENPKSRGVSMVFQSYALYPHMTVAENLAFPLKMARVAQNEINSRIKEIAGMLDLGELLQRKPAQLSGGQKQRIAMGRALARNPQVLLFDEPLSNLDAQLRVRVRSEIAALHKRIRSTIVYVTHDQVEAMTLADRIAVLNKGNLEQFGAPLEVYSRPSTRFVASFIGTPPMNFVRAETVQGVATPSQAALIGFRPETTTLHATLERTNGSKVIGRGRVSLIEPLGGTTHIHLRLGDDTIVAEVRDQKSRHLGDEFEVCTSPESLFFFDGSGRRLEARG